MSDSYHYEDGAIHHDHKKVLHIDKLQVADLQQLIRGFFRNDAEEADFEEVTEDAGWDKSIIKDPYEALLMEMIEPLKDSGKWKEIIMPYHAAVVEGVLPKWSHKIFVEKTGLNVSSSSYSLCMSDGSYTPYEMEPYSEKFAQLKRQLDNSK